LEQERSQESEKVTPATSVKQVRSFMHDAIKVKELIRLPWIQPLWLIIVIHTVIPVPQNI